ncbi:hypothetical protein ABQE45_20430 [Mycobacteroides chelonae]
MGERWSDEELAIALDPSRTCAQAAIQLHRTMGAVHAARMMYPNGRTHELGRSRRWSSADIAILTDPALTVKEMAEKLGRSVGSVYYARHRFTREVAPNQHGTSTGWQYGCKCGPCQQYNRDQLAEKDLAADAARARAFNRKRQDQTIPSATNHGQPWTPKTSEQPATHTFPYWTRPCN